MATSGVVVGAARPQRMVAKSEFGIEYSDKLRRVNLDLGEQPSPMGPRLVRLGERFEDQLVELQLSLQLHEPVELVASRSPKPAWRVRLAESPLSVVPCGVRLSSGEEEERARRALKSGRGAAAQLTSRDA